MAQYGADRIQRIFERGVHSVAHHLDDGPPTGFDRVAKHLVMAREGRSGENSPMLLTPSTLVADIASPSAV